MIVEKREQAVGSSDPEDEEETDEAKAKALADQEVKNKDIDLSEKSWRRLGSNPRPIALEIF